MPAQRKVFRIEQMKTPAPSSIAGPLTVCSAGAPPPSSQSEILTELQALRALIMQRPGGNTPGDSPVQGIELRRLKAEAENIQRAISRTKREIATVQVRAFDGADHTHVTRQLGAVADGSERAAQRILDEAEHIEDAADTLIACLKREQERALAHDIRDHAFRIFEACNFQDLGGQRINKVIATLTFVEECVSRMMAVWGGMDAFRHDTAAAISERTEAVALHGPKLDGDAGHASQADVDKLFAR